MQRRCRIDREASPGQGKEGRGQVKEREGGGRGERQGGRICSCYRGGG